MRVDGQTLVADLATRQLLRIERAAAIEMHQGAAVDGVDAHHLLQEDFHAWSARALGVRAGIEGAVVHVVVEQAGRARRTAGDERCETGNGIREAWRVGIRVGHAVTSQCSDVRASLVRDATRQVPVRACRRC